MDKAPVTTEEPFEEKALRSSRLKRRERACKDKRRDHEHCGLCGSGNLAYSGVLFCDKCGAEGEYFDEESAINLMFKASNDSTLPCSCSGRHQGHYIWRYDFIEVQLCLDCKAVGARTCPVCGKDQRSRFRLSSCWTGVYGEKFCQNCGFRTKGFVDQKGE